MWWSKQGQAEELSFSPSHSSTGTIDSPVEAPESQPTGTTSFPAITPKTERITKRDVSGNDDLRLDVVVDGTISLRCQKLIVGETAKADLDVFAREIVVYGQLTGHLQATERIDIKRPASVVADIIAPRIAIDPGAYFKGTAQIERRKKPRAASA